MNDPVPDLERRSMKKGPSVPPFQRNDGWNATTKNHIKKPGLPRRSIGTVMWNGPWKDGMIRVPSLFQGVPHGTRNGKPDPWKPVTDEEEAAFEIFLRRYPPILSIRELEEAWEAFEAGGGAP